MARGILGFLRDLFSAVEDPEGSNLPDDVRVITLPGWSGLSGVVLAHEKGRYTLGLPDGRVVVVNDEDTEAKTA